MDISKIVLITTIFAFLNNSATLAKSVAVIDNEPEFRDPIVAERRLSSIVEEAATEEKRLPSTNWLMFFYVFVAPILGIATCIGLIVLTKYSYKKWKKARIEAWTRRRERSRSKSRDKSGEKKTKGGGSQRQKPPIGGTKSSFEIKTISDNFPKSTYEVPEELDLMAAGGGGGTVASRWGTTSISSTAKSTTKSAATASRMVGGTKSAANSASAATSMHAAKGVVTPDTISEESTSDREKSKEENSDENNKK